MICILLCFALPLQGAVIKDPVRPGKDRDEDGIKLPPRRPLEKPIEFTFDKDGKPIVLLVRRYLFSEADLALGKTPVDKLLKDYAENEEYYSTDAINARYHSGEPYSDPTAIEDERLLANLEAEAGFYSVLQTLNDAVGMTAIASAIVSISDALKQAQGWPPARIALVLSIAAKLALMSFSDNLALEKATLDTRIAELKQALKDREAALFETLENGTLKYPTAASMPLCIYRTKCYDGAKICTSQGLFEKPYCYDTPVCASEPLTCKTGS